MVLHLMCSTPFEGQGVSRRVDDSSFLETKYIYAVSSKVDRSVVRPVVRPLQLAAFKRRLKNEIHALVELDRCIGRHLSWGV